MSEFDKYASESNEIKPERIMGWTVVITLHVLAAGLLLLPVSPAKQDAPARNSIQVALIEAKPEPPPPPPPPEEPKEIVIAPKKAPPVAKPTPRPPPPQNNAPVIDAPARAVDIAAEPPAPPAPVREIAPAAPPQPSSGGQLVATVAPTPPYPPAALRVGAQGTVVLEIVVGPDGSPIDVRIRKSSGNRDLDRAAQRHVKTKWRFQSTGQQHIGILPVDFTLG